MSGEFNDPPRCVTGKLTYATSRLAEEALAEQQAKRERQGNDRVEGYTYPCKRCGGHHVSSDPERPVERAYGRGRRRRSPRGRR